MSFCRKGGWSPLIYLTFRIYLDREIVFRFSRKRQEIVREVWKRDVFGNHVIPVKLVGELSQALDSLRMGCDGLLITKFI